IQGRVHAALSQLLVKGERQPEARPSLEDGKRLRQTRHAKRPRCRSLWLAHHETVNRGEGDLQRYVSPGNRAAVNMQPRLDLQLDRQPATLKQAVAGCVEIGTHGEAGAADQSLGAVGAALDAKRLLEQGGTRLALAITL